MNTDQPVTPSTPIDYYFTLDKVRELSERAYLRPAPKHLNCGPWPPKPRTHIRRLQEKREQEEQWSAFKSIKRRDQQRCDVSYPQEAA